MKSAKFSTTLIVAGFLGTAATLVSLPAKAETVKITLKDVTNTNTQNYPTVEVTLDDAANPGSITATVKVVPGSTGYIGDLRGVFFNLPGVSNLQITPVSGGPLTNISTNGNFSKFSNSANLNGTDQSFNVGVEVGRQGIANGDDYQITTFKISGTDLKLSCFSESTIGVRLMSVGLPGSNRSLSSKTIGTVPTIVAGNSGGGSTGSSQQAGGGSTGSSQQAGGGSTGSSEQAGGGSTGSSQQAGGGSTGSSEQAGGGSTGSSEQVGGGSTGSSEQAGGGSTGSSEQAGGGSTGSSEQAGGGSTGSSEQAGGGSTGSSEQAGGGSTGSSEQAGGGSTGSSEQVGGGSTGSSEQVGGGSTGSSEQAGGGNQTPGSGGDVEAVPEPTTIGGLALGFGALMKWRNSRRNK